MWRECYDTAIHPPSEARTTRGQKMNREIVNCVALKPPKRNFRGKYVLPPSRDGARDWAPPNGSVVRNLPALQESQEMWVRYLGPEDSLKESMAAHSRIQYSCLENFMQRGPQGATVHRVSKSQTQLKQLSMQRGIICWKDLDNMLPAREQSWRRGAGVVNHPRVSKEQERNTKERIIANAGVYYGERTKVTFYMTLDKLFNIQCWQNL